MQKIVKKIKYYLNQNISSWKMQLCVGTWSLFVFTVYFGYNHIRFMDTFSFIRLNIFSVAVLAINFLITVAFFLLFLPFVKKKSDTIEFSLTAIILLFLTFTLLIMGYVSSAQTNTGNSIPMGQLVLDNLLMFKEILFFPILTFWVIFVTFGIGKQVITYFEIYFEDDIEERIYSFAVGLIFIIHLMLIIGLAHLFYVQTAYILLLILTFVVRKQLREILIFCTRPIFRINRKPFFCFEKFVIFALIFCFAQIFLSSYSQILTEYDGLSSVFRFVKNHAETHYIVQSPYYLLSYFPRGGEMALTFLYLLGGLKASFLFINMLGFLIVLSTGYLLAKNSANKKIFFFVIFIISTIPILFFNFYIRRAIENFYVFYIILSIFCLIRYAKSSDKKILALSFIFAGLSFSIKYTAIFSILSLYPISLYLLYKKERSIAIKLKYSLLLPAIVVIFFAPWAIKNFQSTGNPIAPLFIEQLNNGKMFYQKIGKDSLSYSVKAYLNHKSILYLNQPKKDLFYYAGLPVNATFFFMGRNWDYLDITPLILLAFPLMIIFFRRLNSGLKIFFVFSMFHLLLWIFFGEGTIWYLLPSLLGFSIIISAIFYEFRYSTVFRYIIFPFVVLLTFINLYQVTIQAASQSSLIIKDAETKYSSTDDLFNVYQYINHNVSDKNNLILMVYTEPAYYLDNNSFTALPDFEFEKSGYVFKNSYSLEGARNNFERLGIKYFVSPNNRQAFMKFHAGVKESPETIDLIGQFFHFRDRYLTEIYATSNYSLYVLKSDEK